MTFGNTLPAVSNLASFSEQIEFLDSDTSEKLNLSAAQDIIVTIASDRCRDGLQGSLVGGEVVMADDFLSCTVSFTKTQMQTLSPRTYDLGARIIFEYDIDEVQAALGFLPVVEGV
jgi:hypothetical protein